MGAEQRIEFVDQTIRDAQQSLWAFLMSTDMIEPIAPALDRVGYKAIATVGSNGYVVQVRYFGEDPWERVRLLARALERTPLRGSFMTTSLATFEIDTPREVIGLWIDRSVANGIDEFWICDYQNHADRFAELASRVKDRGARVVTSLMYTTSPVHDDAFWARQTRKIVEARDCVDAIMIEDATGVLTPELTRSLVATVQANCEGIPLEFHAHCTSGLAVPCYLEAIQLGVTTVHTAVAPLANGSSLPSTETILRNAKRLSYASNIDEEALAAVSAHFRAVAEREGLPVGAPAEYDVFLREHQIPGGMIANLRRQLSELGMEGRLDEVLEEVVRVRRELGYPVMATPFSQIVAVQALENVVAGERYARVPNAVVKYVLGWYGEPAGPIDPDVTDRVTSLPEAAKLAGLDLDASLKTLRELREELGPDLSDDELLVRILVRGKGGGRPPERERPAVPAASAAEAPARMPLAGEPMAFTVDVDGEVFHVKVFPEQAGAEQAVSPAPVSRRPPSLPPGAVVADAAGMLLSIKPSVGDVVHEGDVIAVVEAMKMMREVRSPRSGVVSEVHVRDGETVNPGDPLLVIESHAA
jgi:pyruvate/oxaloacetate carboxyltransferase